MLVVGLLMGFLTLAVGLWGQANDRPWQTMVFTTLALLQLGNALAVRSEKESFFKLGIFTNMYLLWTVLITVAIQIVIIYWGPLQRILKTEALSAQELVIVLVVSTGAFIGVELDKWIKRRTPTRD